MDSHYPLHFSGTRLISLVGRTLSAMMDLEAPSQVLSKEEDPFIVNAPHELTPLLGNTNTTHEFNTDKFDYGTAWIIFKSQMGTGCLALPYAVTI